ncbi:MAG: hypothetical protein H6567_03430 [Lewinellaceae bacterium]|nr:hypothetical protein [Lewinellaceae bacterium]
MFKLNSVLMVCLLTFNCTLQKDRNFIGNSITPRSIFKGFLARYIKVEDHKNVCVCKGFQNDVNDPSFFIRKYSPMYLDDDSFINSQWLKNSYTKRFSNVHNCNGYQRNIDNSPNESNGIILKLSKFYFFKNNTGFFIASQACESCEEANIYGFKLDSSNSVVVELLSPYFID